MPQGLAIPREISVFQGLDTAEAVCQRFNFMTSDRWRLEAVWRDVTALFYPLGPRWEDMESRGGRTMDPVWQEARSSRRGRQIYDSTGVVAAERLSSGVESMITPQAQTWHSLDIEGGYAYEENYESEVWTDNLVNYMFKSRYDPRSGFLMAHQNAIKSTVALGTGVYFAEENFGTTRAPASEIPIKYITIPLNETFLGINGQLEHDTCFRLFKLSARQAVERFGKDRLSQKLVAKSEHPSQMDERYDFLHAVYPSHELSSRTVPGDFPFVSMYIEMDTKHELSFSGFREFPYIVYTWNIVENAPYGEAPSFACLPEVKSLQVMARDALLASQSNVRPAVATAFDLERPLNLNPGEINPNMVDPNTGRPMVQRIIDPLNPQMWEATREIVRNQVRDSMYTNLFQVTNDTQYRTATEAAIRDAEKAELLGPASTRIQRGLASLIDREIGILERKGAFTPESFLAPPDSVRGANINVRFTSPIDRARRISEVTGMQHTLEFGAQLAAFDPEVLDNFDSDAMLHIARDLLGAPAESMEDPNVVAQDRELKKRAERAAQTAGMIEQAGNAAKAAGEGAAAVSEGMGGLANMMAGAGLNPEDMTGIPGVGGQE